MKKRVRLVVLFVSVVSAIAVTGTASAQAWAKTAPICVVHSLPSFVDQGEFTTSSSVADIVQVECQPVFAEQSVTLRAQQLFNRCANHLSWSSPFPMSFVEGPVFTVKLDNDGNATAALWGGPSCAAGESLISAHLNTAPFTTVTTTFNVLPPKTTPAGVRALPRSEVEDSEFSSAATVIQVEFPAVFSQRKVSISSGELLSRCQVMPGIVWVGADQKVLGTSTESVEVELDNNGNAFVVALAGASCAAGTSTIEASLVGPPFTTFTNTFTILSPRPTI